MQKYCTAIGWLQIVAIPSDSHGDQSNVQLVADHADWPTDRGLAGEIETEPEAKTQGALE
jgi:hypothetical protein